MSKDLSRMLTPSTIGQAAQVLEHTGGVVPDAATVGGVSQVAGEFIRAEGALWPTVYSRTGVNALVGDAMLGVCLRGPTDSLLMMTNPNGATYDPGEVPVLGADRQAQPALHGKPRIAAGQPVLVVKPTNFGVSVNNAALNVGEPLVTPHALGGMGDYSRSLYDVVTSRYANDPDVGKLDVTRYGALDSALVPRKVIPRGVQPGPNPDAAVALNFGPGTRTKQYSGVGHGYFAALAKGTAPAATPAPATPAGPTITGRQRPTFQEIQAWLAQGGTPLTGNEYLFDDNFQRWLKQYRASNQQPIIGVQAPNLPGIAAGRTGLDYGGAVPLNAYLANMAGGPIIPGFQRDKHRFGINADNEATNPGTLATSALYGSGLNGQEKYHAPLDFELTDEPEVIDPPGTPVRVHLQYDDERFHTINTAGIPEGRLSGSMTRPGLFRWHVRVPLRYPQDPPALPTHDQGRFDPPYFPPTIGPPQAGDGIEGAGFTVIGQHRQGAPVNERIGVPWLGTFSGLNEVNAHGNPVYTYEPTIDGPTLAAAGDDETVAFQARKKAGTADGVVIFHPPELRPVDAIYGAVVPTGRMVSTPTLALHRAQLGFGKVSTDRASVVEGWRLGLNTTTGVLDASYYDSAGALDATKTFTINGSAIGGGLTDPLTTRGDIIYRDATNTTVRKGIGAASYTLQSDGTDLVYGQVSLTAGVTGDLPFANLAQIAGLSVLGVAGNSTADVAAITAGTDHQVMRRSGTALAFGAVNLASSNAVTGALTVPNGGTGLATVTTNRVLTGNGTSALQVTPVQIDVSTGAISRTGNITPLNNAASDLGDNGPRQYRDLYLSGKVILDLVHEIENDAEYLGTVVRGYFNESALKYNVFAADGPNWKAGFDKYPYALVDFVTGATTAYYNDGWLFDSDANINAFTRTPWDTQGGGQQFDFGASASPAFAWLHPGVDHIDFEADFTMRVRFQTPTDIDSNEIWIGVSDDISGTNFVGMILDFGAGKVKAAVCVATTLTTSDVAIEDQDVHTAVIQWDASTNTVTVTLDTAAEANTAVGSGDITGLGRSAILANFNDDSTAMEVNVGGDWIACQGFRTAYD